MPKIKVSEAPDVVLDWLVGQCEGKNGVLHGDGITRCIVVAAASGVYKGTWKPTVNWSQGGPIIERERITVLCAEGDYSSRLRGYKTLWVAEIGQQNPDTVYGSQGDDWGQHYQIAYDGASGPTPLITAMRCYVTAKLGDEVEIPEELL
jgi:hypothetical protein